MANRFLPGYPHAMRNGVTEAIFDHDGPNPYSNVATNGGTGDVILSTALTGNAGTLGISMGNSDAISSDGLNYVLIEYLPYGAAAGQDGHQVSQIRLRWFVLATNAEVANGVDLSGKSVRLQMRIE